MARLSTSVFNPIAKAEIAVLRSCAIGLSVEHPTEISKALLSKGYLLKTGTGMVVTPEGLAALLAAVPIEGLNYRVG
jgi:hypothetical protein